MKKLAFVVVTVSAAALSQQASANPFKICLADTKNHCSRVGAPSDAIYYEHNKGTPVSDEAAAKRFCSSYMINGKAATKYSNVRVATSSGGSAGVALVSVTCAE
jgi:hypothetical protein